MSSLEADFRRAPLQASSLQDSLERIVRLRLYALFMQATSGDASGHRPGFSDFEGRSHWDAWHALSGVSREDAMAEYVFEVGRLKSRQLQGVTE